MAGGDKCRIIYVLPINIDLPPKSRLRNRSLLSPNEPRYSFYVKKNCLPLPDCSGRAAPLSSVELPLSQHIHGKGQGSCFYIEANFIIAGATVVVRIEPTLYIFDECVNTNDFTSVRLTVRCNIQASVSIYLCPACLAVPHCFYMKSNDGIHCLRCHFILSMVALNIRTTALVRNSMTRHLGSIDKSGVLPPVVPPNVLIYSNHLMDLDGIGKMTVVACPCSAGQFPS